MLGFGRFIETDNHFNPVDIITFRAVGQARHINLLRGNINQAGFFFDIKMMMRVNIGIEIAARLVNLHLPQQTGRVKLIGVL